MIGVLISNFKFQILSSSSQDLLLACEKPFYLVAVLKAAPAFSHPSQHSLITKKYQVFVFSKPNLLRGQFNYTLLVMVL